MVPKILIVDDDKNICELLKLYLEKDLYRVSIAHDGADALKKFKTNFPDLVLLDVMLPSIDGLQVLKEIRTQSAIPVIMLTAKDETFDKVLGLEMGADDYIAKPFEMKEVLARIKAVLRRVAKDSSETFDEKVEFDNISINLTTYELKVNDKIIYTPPKELELLFCLAKNKNKVFTRDELLDKVWGFDFAGDTRTVDVHIKRLREKLEGVSNKWALKTVWGVGYKFEVSD